MLWSVTLILTTQFKIHCGWKQTNNEKHSSSDKQDDQDIDEALQEMLCEEEQEMLCTSEQVKS